MKHEEMRGIVKYIDLKMARLVRFTDEEKLSPKDKENFLKNEFYKALALYGITDSDYLNYVLENN